MSDETANKETEPGTSKEDQEGATRDDRNRTDRESHIEKDDRDSYTESTESAVSSARERTEYMAERRANILKSPVLKQGKGGERKKRRKVAGGRVGKSSRSIGRRKLRRGLKKRAKPQNRKYRVPSASTIFTRMTSISGSTRSAGISRIRGCEYCGHRCCRRRFQEELRSLQNSVRVRRKPRNVTMKGSKSVQAGSRCAMLSPLFISTNTAADIMELAKTYCEITPEMICESLRRLTKWRQYVSAPAIINDMMKYFPVNPDELELMNELSNKLVIAAIVGFVVQEMIDDKEFWCLNCDLLGHKLTKNHVEVFWKLYGDTMKPVIRKKHPADNIIFQAEGTSTEEKMRNGEYPTCVNDYFI